ncbi:hypothetical protein [Mycoplasmopsis bovis]|nr:hypothetical protein [Mycoplasmopsis bovis]
MKTEQINNNQSNIQQSVAQTNPSNNNVTVIRHEHTFADHSQKKFILILRYTLIIGAVFAFLWALIQYTQQLNTLMTEAYNLAKDK